MSAVDYRVLYLAQEGRCFYCERELQPGRYRADKRRNGFTRDHFYPRSSGNGLIENAVLACRPCNLEKAHYWPDTETIERFNSLMAQYELRRALDKSSKNVDDAA